MHISQTGRDCRNQASLVAGREDVATTLNLQQSFTIYSATVLPLELIHGCVTVVSLYCCFVKFQLFMLS
jgi:hypothetical protein